MSLKVHRVVVVGCPRCIFTGEGHTEGIGKSCFCNRFVRPDAFKKQHPSMLSGSEWRENSIYNRDHFLYWGAATKRLPDGSKVRFQVVEQTEFYTYDGQGSMHRFSATEDYITRASTTNFISRNKVAYRVHEEEEYAIPSSLKFNYAKSRATQLFPNIEFSEGKGVTGFICLFDPTLKGQDLKKQIDFTTELLKQLLKTKRKVLLACTKCDIANEGFRQLAANLATTVTHKKKPLPYIETSAFEGINIDEAFYYVVGGYKKKTIKRSSTFTMSYSDMIESRSHDETFLLNVYTRFIKDRVRTFDTEWSDIWPAIQFDTCCKKTVELVGIERAKKVFCNHLMELKVQELKNNSKNQQSSQSQTFQAEVLKAFSEHPDLSTGDSLYDFPCTSTTDSSSTPTTTTTTPPPPNLPLTDPPSKLFSPERSSSPINRSSMSPHSSLTQSMSPPPPPPTSSIPVFQDSSNNRAVAFSPTEAPPLLSKLNRSMEFLASVPISPKQSSLRYKNRTLPPLPTGEAAVQPSSLARGDASLAKSQPMLDELITPEEEESHPERPQRLSSSMDCLLTGDTPAATSTTDEQVVDINVEPYLRPVEMRAAFSGTLERQRKGTATVRLPSTLPHVERQRTQSLREKQYTRTPLPAQFMAPTSPPVAITERRISSSKSPSHIPIEERSPSPILVGQVSLSPNSSSLDFLDNPRPLLPEHDTTSRALSNSTADNDTDSVMSGPFEEIDEPCTPPKESGHGSTNSLPSATRPLARKMPLNLIQHNKTIFGSQDSTLAKTTEKENIYNVIGTDAEYLTMREGVSLEDLLQRKGRSTSTPSPQVVVQRLKYHTRALSELDPKRLSNSSRHHKTSDASMKSVFSYIDTVIEEAPTLAMQGHVSTGALEQRPLPPSPRKLKRATTVTNKRRLSGDGNIYESIDEQNEWLQPMRRQKQLARHPTKLNRSELSDKCQKAIDTFLQNTTVQQLWLTAIQSVIPEFKPPENGPSPFLLNPEYFAMLTRSQKPPQTEVEDKPPLSPSEYITMSRNASISPEMKPKAQPSMLSAPINSHAPVTVTDSFVMRMNQQNEVTSDEGTESEDESEDESEPQDDSQYHKTMNSHIEMLLAMGLPEIDMDSITKARTDPLGLDTIHQTFSPEDSESGDIIPIDSTVHITPPISEIAPSHSDGSTPSSGQSSSTNSSNNSTPELMNYQNDDSVHFVTTSTPLTKPSHSNSTQLWNGYVAMTPTNSEISANGIPAILEEC